MSFILSEPYARVYESFMAFASLRVTGQGYGTLEKNVRLVLKWFEREDIILEEATIQDALSFRYAESSRTKKDGNPVSSGTVCNRLKAARSVFRWMVLKEMRKTNPFDEVKNPRVGEPLSRNVLTEAQMGVLLEKLTAFDEAGDEKRRVRRYRVHVIAEVLYASGLRIAEAASLIPDNVDVRQRLIYVPEGKGQKARVAFLTSYASDVLRLYLEEGRAFVFGSYDRPNSHTLFGAWHGRLMAVVNEEVEAVCRSLDLPVITSHGFRHSLGTHLLRNGCDMRHIQAILGHERLATTEVYTRVDKDELRESLDTFHPRRMHG
ncbi:tyrosine-type recombinase/integrase [Brucepastera parasyntrophica]|uniref:tyrosine-type recombinase/integrase n=1 Tax=Brucepastera parasyntrophica TaxID=2880008 RepID=UPI002109C9F0|nr:tyrosine-type recombinase/integrase [Brucepastera parasyntrophica]ULQ59103.1 tyrosine-type recombinase/integrase [Brucepastera parasyntrophica]ULQ59114.1 tyrosine-type recombinase/integrase [Brucepastera parasyntrophica]